MALPICLEFIIRFFFEIIRFALQNIFPILIIVIIAVVLRRWGWIFLNAALFLITFSGSFIPELGLVVSLPLVAIIYFLMILLSPASWPLKLLGGFGFVLLASILNLVMGQVPFLNVILGILIGWLLNSKFSSNILLLILGLGPLLFLILVSVGLFSLFSTGNICADMNNVLIGVEQGRNFLGLGDNNFLVRSLNDMIQGRSFLP